MRTFSTKIATGILLVVWCLTSCDRDDQTRMTSVPSAPCDITLVPHTGADRIDQHIMRLQQQVRHADDPIAYLERLGWAYISKARVSYDAGFYRLAEQSALCIEARKRPSAEALLLRGHVLHNLHRFKEAEVLARQLVRLRGLAYDYGLLGDVVLEQGKLTEAGQAYQEMMDQQPSPQAYSRAAHLRWLTGDVAGAITLMHLAIGTSGFRDPEAAAWANVRLAFYELQAGDMQKASRHLTIALTLHPDYAPALVARGRLLLAEDKAAEAIAPLTQAVQLNPLPEYQWAFIEALRATGRTHDAHATEDQLMQRGATEDRRTFALYLASVGQEAERALHLAEQELDVRTDVFTLDTVAWALNAAGRHQEAYAYSKRALTESTQDARLFYHTGAIAMALGRHDEAKPWLAKAVSMQQTLLPSEREHLANVSAALSSQTTPLSHEP